MLKRAEVFFNYRESLLAKYGLNKKQMDGLIYLWKRKKKIPIGELIAPLETSNTCITRLVEALVRKKLSTRTPFKKDRRSWAIKITRKGIELVESYKLELVKFFDQQQTHDRKCQIL